jgi:type IV pilus assembly protein PilM
MDLKKEIKLGDLIPRRRRGEKRAERGDSRSSSSKSLVGLKIGASQIAAARVVSHGAIELVQVAREGLEPGVVVGGEVRNPEALAEALRSFFAMQKLPRKGIRLGIATNRIGVRAFDVSGIEDPKQLANAVRFRAQEALPIPMHEAVLDYQVLSEDVNDAGETVRRILLVVTYRELIDRYVSACQQAGLELSGIDLEAFALLRALASPRDAQAESAAALVAVSVGHDRSTFAVSDGRVCEFTRVLDWGGGTLNVAIARALDLAPSEAEPIKRSLSVTGREIPEGLTEADALKAQDALRREIQSFARELVSSLQFYQNQPGSLGIGEIVLTGGTAHLQGFARQLEGLIGVTVRVGDPLARVRNAESVATDGQVGSLTVAIGLGIED